MKANEEKQKSVAIGDGIKNLYERSRLHGKKEKDTAEELQELVEECAERYALWKNQRATGVSDPFWSDGVNLNLVRNHIKYAKNRIKEHCAKHGLIIPYRALPPEMPNDFYVVTGKHYQRLGLCGGSGNVVLEISA